MKRNDIANNLQSNALLPDINLLLEFFFLFYLYLVHGMHCLLATHLQDKEESIIKFEPVGGYVDMSIYF